MKTRKLITSTLMISSALLVIGCGSVADTVKQATDALTALSTGSTLPTSASDVAKITGTMPSTASGTQVQAICADGTIRQSNVPATTKIGQNVDFTLEVPKNQDCSLNMITNKDNKDTRVITPIQINNGGKTIAKSINLSQDIKLPALTEGTRDTNKETSVAKNLTVVGIKDTELKTKAPADVNDDGIPDIYEPKKGASDTTPRAFVQPSGETKPLIDIDKNNNGIADFLEGTNNSDSKAHVLIEDQDNNGKPDYQDREDADEDAFPSTGSSTSGASTPATPSTMPSAKFVTNVMPLFNACKGCHIAGKGRKFIVSDAIGTYHSLMNNNLINTTTATNSMLLQRNDGTLSHKGGEQFPKTSQKYMTIKAWIMNGAKND